MRIILAVALLSTTILTVLGCTDENTNDQNQSPGVGGTGQAGSGGGNAGTGNASSGSAGVSADGGTAGSAMGGQSAGGSSAGTGGNAGAAAGGAGGAAGVGGSGAGAGTGGMSNCQELELTNFQGFTDGSIRADISPSLGADGADYFLIELVDGMTGSFNLTEGDDINYKTCSHCFSVFQDVDNAGSPSKRFFQISGTTEITVADPDLNATSAGSINDLTLIEVTIAGGGDYTSTPVEGGSCLHVTMGMWDTTQ